MNAFNAMELHTYKQLINLMLCIFYHNKTKTISRLNTCSDRISWGSSGLLNTRSPGLMCDIWATEPFLTGSQVMLLLCRDHTLRTPGIEDHSRAARQGPPRRSPPRKSPDNVKMRSEPESVLHPCHYLGEHDTVCWVKGATWHS